MGGAYGEEGVNDVGLDGAERFVPDHDEDLLLFLQVDEVSEPGLLGQPAGEDGVRLQDGSRGYSVYCVCVCLL